jgi:acyl carrier protein
MSTLQTLQAIFTANFDQMPEMLVPATTLADLDIDSLAMIEILFAVEDEFGIKVPSEPLEWKSEMRTVGDLVRYVDRLIAEQHPAMTAGARDA